MAGTKTTPFLATQGVTITKDEDFLIINNGKDVYQFDVSLPGLHLRVHEVVKESIEGSDGVKPDLPYTPLNTQLKCLGVEDENLPASLLGKMKMLKEKSAECSITTEDHGDSYTGVVKNAAGEVYVRVLSSDPNELCDLAEEYPDGLDHEEDGEVLFIYGRYRGASAGYCPPIPKEAVRAKVPDAKPKPEAKAEEEDLGGAEDVRGSGSFSQDGYADLGSEKLSPEEQRARNHLNAWVTQYRFGERFKINTSGEFEVPGVMGMFATGRFELETSSASSALFKHGRTQLSQNLLDACEQHQGQISALRVVAICFKKSNMCGKPDWPLFLKFLGQVVPSCLNYIGGRFVSKDGFGFVFEEEQTGGDFDF